MNDPSGSRSARIADMHHLLHLADRFPRFLPVPSVSFRVASFNYTGETSAEDAARAVLEARRILSRHAALEFTGGYSKAIGSARCYVYEAVLPSGLHVCIVAGAEAGPLLEAEDTGRVLAEVA